MSRVPRLLLMAACLALGSSISIPDAGAQVFDRLKKTVKKAAEDETMRNVDRLVRGKVRCVFDDLECIRKAEESGKGAVLTDDRGEILVDQNGEPVTNPNDAKQIASADRVVKPGEGAWANYDFKPGDEILVYDDFMGDKVGDFPRRFELIEGNFEVIEWEGGRYLRATANGVVAIPLPKTLPEKFTLEYSVSVDHGNASVRVMTGRQSKYKGSAPSIEYSQAGLRSLGNAGPQTLSTIDAKALRTSVVPVRLMADGDHMKMYFDEQRVANAPNAVFPRSDTLFIAVSWASAEHPILVGPIRIAGGGLDLYDRLTRDGRVTTQGIFFASGSDRIRPESTPTLKEIATMLEEHPALRLSIEGHTDADGEDGFNQSLSERRAAAVKAYLVAQHAVDAARLETAGFGESAPVSSNDTPEGKQQNRRVELVRLDR